MFRSPRALWVMKGATPDLKGAAFPDLRRFLRLEVDLGVHTAILHEGRRPFKGLRGWGQGR